MAIAELEELMAMLATPEDRVAFEQILERAPAAKDRTVTSEDLSRSLLDNDSAAAARVEARKQEAARRQTTPPPTQQTQPPATTPGIDPTQLDNMVAAKVRELIPTLLKGEYEKPDFNDRIKGLVKTTADEMVPGLISRTTRTADEIAQIRMAHKEEFGKPLDTTVFTTFIEDAAKKGKTYGSYVDAHNDFVQEQRIEARIAKGVADGLAAKKQAELQVPGTSLAGTSTVMQGLLKANPLNKDAAGTRGDAINQGAQALFRLRAGRVE